MINDTNREKIKDAAVKLALADGIFHPSTAEITLAAGVSRTLLHYYFKDKNEIQELVTTQAMALYGLKMQQLFLKDTDLRDRIIDFSETAFELSLSYPFLDSFVVKEARSNPVLEAFLKGYNSTLDLFVNELENHITQEGLFDRSADELVMRLFSAAHLPPNVGFHGCELHKKDGTYPGFGTHYKTFLRNYVLEILLKYRIF